MADKQEAITEDEAALYDRQIRLWGLDAQKRLRAARVLLAGVSGLGAEVAKNIVLSGIKSLTLLDDSLVTEEDACSQFLVSRDDCGENRAECSLTRTQRLNPMVQVTADSGCIKDKDEDFFKAFDVVCVTCASTDQLTRVNDICHKHGIKFYSGDVWGHYGYMFADLGDHEYAEEVKQQNKKSAEKADDSGEPATKKAKTDENETKTVKKTANFVRLKTALGVNWANRSLRRTPPTYFTIRVLQEFRDQHDRDPLCSSLESDQEELVRLREEVLNKLEVSKKDMVPPDFASYCFAELSPVCAVVGGVLGQEIIKAVSKKDTPHNNHFFFSGRDSIGMVDNIKN